METINNDQQLSTDPINTVKKRTKKDTQFKPGNPGGPGRPTGKSLKEFQAEMFRLMTDEQKINWLIENKVSGETRWKMAEGNPKNDVDISGEVISKIIKLDE